MRVLLDECLPRPLKRELADHEVWTVPEAGWAGKDNGELLRLAQGRFDVFLTSDRGVIHQQDLRGIALAVVVLRARSNDVDDIRPLMPGVRDLLLRIRPGEVVRIGG